MALGTEDDPRMAADAEVMTQVQEHVVTLRLVVRTDQDEPEGWDWQTLLDLHPTESVAVVGVRQDGQPHLVDEEGRPHEQRGAPYQLFYARDGDTVVERFRAEDEEAAENEATRLVNTTLKQNYVDWEEATADSDGFRLDPE